MNTSDVAKLLRVSRTLWPDIAADEDTITAWSWALGDLPYDVVQRALQVHMRTSPFPPKPSDLRKVIAEEAVTCITWEQAWDEVWQVVQRFGRSRIGHGGWSSPEVQAAVNHIGFAAICDSDMDHIPTIRAQFRDYYDGQRERQVRAYLTGAKPIPFLSAPDDRVVPITAKSS
jgi:hypothetical protein